MSVKYTDVVRKGKGRDTRERRRKGIVSTFQDGRAGYWCVSIEKENLNNTEDID